ncbi:DUF551 domain-containing protein [Cronobacter sakazakii]|uniref:DUF551 domain-containing protein n=1 Tax=Cronobacter sakazakii TaxID=28141 RepID=UPI000A158935|nr:DUF551 domain-containing protein [Cronobacter sakazakii]EKC7174554.1 DUF551 domain-containing protein [Cronobacter sakazakii]EKK5217424.1 DUF551 domain-containing protein [Cronobacter sakazakii]ELY6384841.1 DUF551 domain-containing protein [Cronobacter sakazakii]PUW05292.1 DUF551 domain-containing protein [Cronobacter sakazakii]PUY82488.1 DUF551 domain-containing protein [Cronobacter sakazakii]
MSEIDYERVQFLHDVATECARDGTEIALDADEVILYLTEPLLALRELAEPVGFVGRNKETGKFASWLYPEAPWLTDDKYEVLSAYITPPAPVAAGWIACSERMPELNTRVLLYFPDYGGHIEDGCIGDEGDGHYHYFFDGDSLRHEPTHWMPLPEAPAKN